MPVINTITLLFAEGCTEVSGEHLTKFLDNTSRIPSQIITGSNLKRRPPDLTYELGSLALIDFPGDWSIIMIEKMTIVASVLLNELEVVWSQVERRSAFRVWSAV
jgi:hypothetical protein